MFKARANLLNARAAVSGTKVRYRIGFLVAMFGAAFVGLFFLEPISQSDAYHGFVDTRSWLGVSNFGDVVSNLPYAVAGGLGLWLVLGPAGRDIFDNLADRWPYVLFFIGVGLVSAGSAYYHAAPDSARLFWDRLPMTVGFMALFSAFIADRINQKIGVQWLLPILVVAGTASVFYWDWSESLGRGDLRFYYLVQFYPIVALPVICWLFPNGRYTDGRHLAWVIALYVVAKVLETFDPQVFTILGDTVSGHSLKHLVSAGAIFIVIRMLTAPRRGHLQRIGPQRSYWLKKTGISLCILVSAAFLLSPLTAFPGASANFQKGLEAAGRGNLAAALQEWKPLAEQGHAKAQYILGTMYSEGRGVPQDDTQAVEWYRRASEQGFAPAQFNLGVSYFFGRGVPQDHTQAVKWYRKAAEQDFADAQYNLGDMHLKGRGVSRDLKQAAKWWRLAAEQGDAGAQYDLGVMYSRGLGVPQDHEQALRWWRLAAEQGNANARDTLKKLPTDALARRSEHQKEAKEFRLATELGVAQEHDAEVWKFLNKYAAHLRQSGDERADSMDKEVRSREFAKIAGGITSYTSGFNISAELKAYSIVLEMRGELEKARKVRAASEWIQTRKYEINKQDQRHFYIIDDGLTTGYKKAE